MIISDLDCRFQIIKVKNIKILIVKNIIKRLFKTYFKTVLYNKA